MPEQPTQASSASQQLPNDDVEVPGRFALLINPGAMITAGILLKALVVPLEVQVGLNRYLGIDVGGAFILLDSGDDRVGGVIQGGLRITPLGRYLAGLYVVPRGGYGNLGGALASLEVGYAWFFGHFVLNLGLGALYSSGGEAFDEGFGPVINLSVGVGR